MSNMLTDGGSAADSADGSPLSEVTDFCFETTDAFWTDVTEFCFETAFDPAVESFLADVTDARFEPAPFSLATESRLGAAPLALAFEMEPRFESGGVTSGEHR